MARIEYYDGLQHTPAIPILVQGWHELLLAGKADNVCIINWDHHALVMFKDDDPVSVISFNVAKWVKTAYIQIGYTKPAYRKLGLYRMLWVKLIEKCQELELAIIEGGTHLDNTESRAMMAALGRREFSVFTRFNVPPKPKP